MDDALETVRLYHASCKRRRVQQIPVKRPDSPYVRTEIFMPCESCQPVYDTGGAMLATLMRPGTEYVSVPMIVHAQELPCGTLLPADDEDLYA